MTAAEIAELKRLAEAASLPWDLANFYRVRQWLNSDAAYAVAAANAVPGLLGEIGRLRKEIELLKDNREMYGVFS